MANELERLSTGVNPSPPTNPVPKMPQLTREVPAQVPIHHPTVQNSPPTSLKLLESLLVDPNSNPAQQSPQQMSPKVEASPFPQMSPEPAQPRDPTRPVAEKRKRGTLIHFKLLPLKH